MVVKTKKEQAAAAATSVAAQRWPRLLNTTIDTVVAPHPARPETRATAHDLITALSAPLPAKNCWTLAEHAGHRAPYRIQHLLSRARIDDNALAASLRDHVIAHLGTRDVVLVVDETGDIKQGKHTVGVARQSPPAATRPGGTPRGHRPGRELPGRGLPRPHHPPSARPDRPPPLPARLLDQEPRTAPGGRGPRHDRFRHQTRTGPADDHRSSGAHP